LTPWGELRVCLWRQAYDPFLLRTRNHSGKWTQEDGQMDTEKGAPENPITVEVWHSPTKEAVVYVAGQVTGDASLSVLRVVTDVVLRQPAEVALDVSEVTSIDAGGVQALLSIAAEAAELDISLCLVGAQGGAVSIALADAGLTEAFEISAELNSREPGQKRGPKSS
jgi:anti-sigma B factor antagonist